MPQETNQATDLKKKKEEAKKELDKIIKAFEAPGKAISQDTIKLLKGEITGEKFALTAIEQSIQGIAIFIPPPYGTGVSVVTSLFFGILKGGEKEKPDPLLEHENRMKNFISNENAKIYFDETQQMLNIGMNSLHQVNVDFLNNNHLDPKYQGTIRPKISAILKLCEKLQERFFSTSQSRNYLYTFPLVQRFLLLYKHTIFFTEAFGSPNNQALESPESILMKKKQLYEAIFDFIAKASAAIADDRQEDIKLIYNRKCAYHEIVIHDEKSARDLPWKKSWTAQGKEWEELDSLVEGTAKDTARVIVIEQCLRSTILQVREVYKLDAALFAKALLDAITEEEEAKQQGRRPEDIKRLTDKGEFYEKHFEPVSNLDFTEEYKRVVKAEYKKLGERYDFSLTWKLGKTNRARQPVQYNLESKQILYQYYQEGTSGKAGIVEGWKWYKSDYDFSQLFLDIEREMMVAWQKGGWEKWANLDEANKETEFHLREKDGSVIKY